MGFFWLFFVVFFCLFLDRKVNLTSFTPWPKTKVPIWQFLKVPCTMIYVQATGWDMFQCPTLKLLCQNFMYPSEKCIAVFFLYGFLKCIKNEFFGFDPIERLML